MPRFTLLIFTALMTLPSLSTAESTVSSKGELRFESRFFTDDKTSQTKDSGYGLAGRLEAGHSWKEMQNKVQIFSRVDREDSSRQRLNIEELYSQWLFDEWVFFAGYRTLNWSTAEAFHPTDVINSRNFDGPFENAEKLGEAMVGFQYLSNFFNVFAFFMPTLQSPQLPEQSNRLSFAPQGVAVGEAHFVNNHGEVMESSDFAEQWALRIQTPIDDWEFNFYWVHHFDRTDFRSVLDTTRNQFVPVLNEVDHFSFAFQYVWEAWIFKSENVYRNFQETTTITDYGNAIVRNDYGMSSFAVEYMTSHESGSDTTYILEFQEIYGVDKMTRYLINPFQRDLLFGIRHSLNDIKGREIFLGVIGDLERGREILASASYSQRLSDVWKVRLSGRYIDAPQSGPFDLTGMRPLNNDNQFDIQLSRFF